MLNNHSRCAKLLVGVYCTADVVPRFDFCEKHLTGYHFRNGYRISRDELLELIASRIYDDFRNGAIDFDTCEASLATLTRLADDTEFGIPEPQNHKCPSCGGSKPQDQSCGCFDNNCQ